MSLSFYIPKRDTANYSHKSHWSGPQMISDRKSLSTGHIRYHRRIESKTEPVQTIDDPDRATSPPPFKSTAVRNATMTSKELMLGQDWASRNDPLHPVVLLTLIAFVTRQSVTSSPTPSTILQRGIVWRRPQLVQPWLTRVPIRSWTHFFTRDNCTSRIQSLPGYYIKETLTAVALKSVAVNH